MDTSVLIPGELRNSIYTQHPVVRNAVQIATKSVREAERAVSAAILHRDPGTYFVAEPRVGKTTTIEMIRSVLPQTFPGVPVWDVIAKRHISRSEKTFFGDALLELNQDAAGNMTAARRRGLAFNHLLATCRTLKSDQMVLFVDEGQNWSEFEYELLRDLINDLRKAGIVCVTIIFAHPNLDRKVKVDLLARGRTDLTGRFLVSQHQFRGISSKEELRDVFGAYDSAQPLQFPRGSGVCYSCFFKPQWFEQGWRLGDETNNAWASFTSRSRHPDRSSMSLGMQWVSGAIRNFLFEISQFECPLPTAEIWERAIGAAAYELVV